MGFRLVALGELSLYDSETGRKAAVPRKGLALLTVLASASPKGVSRERILSLLWADAGESGRGALKQTIYELRRTLGNRDVVIGTAELTLDATQTTSDIKDLEDAHSARQWPRVVELYAGPFADGFYLPRSAELDHWLDFRRVHYRELYRRALEKAAADAAGCGDVRAAAALWRQAAADDPLSARTALGLLNALAATGDAAAALTHYRIHQGLLHDELGTQPDAAVTSAAERIRAGGGGFANEATVPVRGPLTAVRSTETSAADVSVRQVPTAGSRALRTASIPRRVWLIAAGLVIVAAILTAAWRAGSRARVLASVSLPQNSSSRVTVDAELRRIYVDGGASFDHALTVVDADTYEARALPHGAGVLVDPVTHWYWSGDYGASFVVVRNGRTADELGRVTVPGCPFSMAIGKEIWVAQQCDDHISVIDHRTREVIRHIRIPTLSRAEVGGAKGMGEIHINPNTGIVYFWKDMIPHRLDPRSWQMRETPGFGGPVLAVNVAANRIYTRIEHGLRVIDGATERAVADVGLPGTPSRAAVGFGGRRIYVVSPQGLSMLDDRSHRVIWTKSFGDDFAPDAVAVDDARGRAYVLGTEADGRRSLKILRLSDQSGHGR